MSRYTLEEAVIFSVIQKIGPKEFVRALSNACCHGEFLQDEWDEYLDSDDKFLREWFEGIEKLDNAVKKAENR